MVIVIVAKFVLPNILHLPFSFLAKDIHACPWAHTLTRVLAHGDRDQSWTSIAFNFGRPSLRVWSFTSVIYNSSFWEWHRNPSTRIACGIRRPSSTFWITFTGNAINIRRAIGTGWNVGSLRLSLNIVLWTFLVCLACQMPLAGAHWPTGWLKLRSRSSNSTLLLNGHGMQIRFKSRWWVPTADRVAQLM